GRQERAAGTVLGLSFGGLAFTCMLVAMAYRGRKRWRPLVAQRSFGGKKRALRKKQIREARINEARSAIAELQAEVARRTLQDPSEITRRAQQILRSAKASRLLRVELGAESGGLVRIWLLEKEPPGSLENWLMVHSYLGFLAVLLVALHSGFRLGGVVATLGAILSGIVGMSGLVGALLYVAIPRALGQIKNPMLPPEIRVKIREVEREMADVLKDKSGPFQEMFLFSEHGLSEEDMSKVEDEEKVHFRHMLELQARKGSMEAYLARHLRYEGYLRGWLYVHVPAATFLLTVVLIHILSILYY
ncbi:MAG: hypothetical protein HYZ81_05980, partial [Nitrospinae bacterium]|nr:hypothetical protein [Nitrospinota bacterium]